MVQGVNSSNSTGSSGGSPLDFFQSLLGMGGAGGGGAAGGGGSPFSSFLGGGMPKQISPFQSSSDGGGGNTGSSSSSSSSSSTGSPGGGKAPTVGEFDSASQAPYGIPTKDGLKPLEVNGKPVQETTQNGTVAQAYVTKDNKVILSFGGTGSGGGSVLAGQIQSDVVGGAGGVSGAQKDAADFTKQVQTIADQQGIGSKNVYVTGHSLGGMEAQYAAAQTGAGGMSFESPGSTKGSNPKGDGSNFVNVRDQSDPIANIGSYYGKTLSVNSGQGILAHAPGAQDSLIPLDKSLSDLQTSLTS